MPYSQFDRHQLVIKPLSERKDKVFIERDHVPVDAAIAHPLSESGQKVMDELVERLAMAKGANKSRMLTFGAHANHMVRITLSTETTVQQCSTPGEHVGNASCRGELEPGTRGWTPSPRCGTTPASTGTASTSS